MLAKRSPTVMNGRAEAVAGEEAAPTMQRPSKRLFRNTLGLAGAQAVAMAAGLISAVVVSRALGPDLYGALGFGTALLSYFALAVILGTDEFGMRQVARAQDPAHGRGLVATIVGLRMTLAAMAVAAVAAVALLAAPSKAAANVLMIQAAGLVFSALMVDFYFQGVQRMGVMALRQAGAAAVSAVAVLLLIREPADVYLAAAIPVFAVGASVLAVAVLFGVESKRLPVRFRPADWPPVLRGALPFAFATFMAAIYSNLDMVMLGFMRPGAEVGWYNAAARLAVLAMVAGNLVRSAFFPALAEVAGDGAKRTGYGDTYGAVLAFLGAPIAVFGILFAAPLLALLFGPAYGPAKIALAILMASCGVHYWALTYTTAALAWDREKTLAKAVAASAAVNVALNFALIPRFGIEGAAAATLISQALVGVVMMTTYRRMVASLNGPAILKAIAAACLAGGVAMAVQPVLGADIDTWRGALIHLLAEGTIFGGVYLAACHVLKVAGLSALLDVLAGRSRVGG